jgi:hypothetical protein
VLPGVLVAGLTMLTCGLAAGVTGMLLRVLVVEGLVPVDQGGP